MKIRLKRAYEPPEKADGTRLLVERLWPRVKAGPATFVFAAKDEKRNSALLLKEFLERKSGDE